jgi:hypothetical protein
VTGIGTAGVALMVPPPVARSSESVSRSRCLMIAETSLCSASARCLSMARITATTSAASLSEAAGMNDQLHEALLAFLKTFRLGISLNLSYPKPFQIATVNNVCRKMLADHVIISGEFMGKVSPFVAAVIIAIIAMLTINAHAQTFSNARRQHHGTPVSTYLPSAPAAAKINSGAFDCEHFSR